MTESTSTAAKRPTPGRYSAEGCGLWTKEEHQRFLDALQVYPNGPWKLVADLVGTRSVRQTMTHAQKHKQKLARHARGLHLRQKISPNAGEPDSALNANKADPEVTATKKTKNKKTRETSASSTSVHEATPVTVLMSSSPHASSRSGEDSSVSHDVGTTTAADWEGVGFLSNFPCEVSTPASTNVSNSESSTSATHALDELLCLVGSTQIMWPEPSTFPMTSHYTVLDPMPFKSEPWTPADDFGVYEFLAGSII